MAAAESRLIAVQSALEAMASRMERIYSRVNSMHEPVLNTSSRSANMSNSMSRAIQLIEELPNRMSGVVGEHIALLTAPEEIRSMPNAADVVSVLQLDTLVQVNASNTTSEEGDGLDF